MCDVMEKLLSGEMVDPTTRLPNRTFLEKMKELIKSDNVWILEIDVSLDRVDSGFKDIAISKVASTIKHSVRLPRDMVVRSGEYEFAVIIGGVEEDVVKTVAKRIKDNIDYMSLSIGGKSVNPTAVVRYTKL